MPSAEPSAEHPDALTLGLAALEHLRALLTATLELIRIEAREHLRRLLTLTLVATLGAVLGIVGLLTLLIAFLAGLVQWLGNPALGLALGAVILALLAIVLVHSARTGFRKFEAFPRSRDELGKTLAFVRPS